MSWITLPMSVTCPACEGTHVERYRLLDETGTLTDVMARHVCGWEEIYQPARLGLVKGRKMNFVETLKALPVSVRKFLKLDGMNVYEILGRTLVIFVALFSVSILAFTWLEGMLNFPISTGWPAEAIIPLNLLGAFTIYKYVLIQSTIEKEK